jgi:hypothetical protein
MAISIFTRSVPRDVCRLTDVAGNDVHSWCAGGDWIVVSSGRKGFKEGKALYDGVRQPYGEIFAMRAEGSDVAADRHKWEDSARAVRA